MLTLATHYWSQNLQYFTTSLALSKRVKSVSGTNDQISQGTQMSTKYQNKYCRSVKDQLGVGSPEGLYPAFFLVVFCLSRTAVPSSGNQCGSVAELVTMNRHQKENIAWLFNVYEKADMRHHTPIKSITNTSRRRTNSSPRRTTIFGHNTIHHSYHT